MTVEVIEDRFGRWEVTLIRYTGTEDEPDSEDVAKATFAESNAAPEVLKAWVRHHLDLRVPGWRTTPNARTFLEDCPPDYPIRITRTMGRASIPMPREYGEMAEFGVVVRGPDDHSDAWWDSRRRYSIDEIVEMARTGNFPDGRGS